MKMNKEIFKRFRAELMACITDDDLIELGNKYKQYDLPNEIFDDEMEQKLLSIPVPNALPDDYYY